MTLNKSLYLSRSFNFLAYQMKFLPILKSGNYMINIWKLYFQQKCLLPQSICISFTIHFLLILFCVCVSGTLSSLPNIWWLRRDYDIIFLSVSQYYYSRQHLDSSVPVWILLTVIYKSLVMYTVIEFIKIYRDSKNLDISGLT